MIGPSLEQARRTSTQRVAFSWQVDGPHCSPSQQSYCIKNKAKSVAYATYTVVSTSTLTTEPFLKSYKSGSSRLQPMKPPRRCARYTNLMACDLHAPMCSHLSEITVSPTASHHCCRLCWVEKVGPYTMAWQLKILLTTGTRCFANSNIKMPSVVLVYFRCNNTNGGRGNE